MKKIVIFLICLVMLFNPINSFATTTPRLLLSQGMYEVKNLKLLSDTQYEVRNTSNSGSSIIEVFDSSQRLQVFLRLEPNSPKYALKPFENGSIIVIIGKAEIEFS